MIGALLDKAVSVVAPVTGLRRKAARMALDLAARNYDAAAGPERFGNWATSGRSANAEIARAGPILRARARDLARNSPFGKRAVTVLSSQMVGTGHHPRLSGINEEVRTAQLANWRSFVEHSDPENQQRFHGQLRLGCSAMVEGGDALIEWFDADPARDGSPMQCRVLEGDWIDSSRTGPVEGGGWVIQGVEMDVRGRRVAYHLHGAHPGEVWTGRATWPTRRVEARYIDHLYDLSRPGQMRGVTWFAPVMTALRDRDDYMDALRQFAKIQASITMIVRNSNAPFVGQEPSLGGSAQAPSSLSDANGTLIENVSPGSVVYASGAEDVEKADAPGLGEATAPIRVWDHDIAAGLGLYHAQLTGDLSQVNYSSLREGKIGFWSLLDVWQAEIVQNAYSKAWRRVHEAHARLGTGPHDWAAADWARPPRPWVDPLKDMQALMLELGAMVKSHMDAIAERGGDAEQLYEEIAEGMESLKKFGIAFNPLSFAAPMTTTEKEAEDAA